MATGYEAATDVVEGASAVTALIGTRYWPDIRKSEVLPALVYRNVTDVRFDHLSAPGKGKQVRMQFNCYAATRTAAEALADALEVALSVTGRVVFRQSSYDTEVEIYWTQLDWLAFVSSPT